MKRATWVLAMTGVGALVGCSGHGTPAVTSASPGSGAPTDFAQFVSEQVQTQPAFGTASPASTASLTDDTALDDATRFATVTFGSGDALPTGTYQGVMACTQAGPTACNPAVSVDLNSKLN